MTRKKQIPTQQSRKGIFLFHRDFRIIDNTALHALAATVDEIIPCFIFDDRQINDHPYRSLFGLQFLIESVTDLASQIHAAHGHLNILHGNPVQVIQTIISSESIAAIAWNNDYTPFARQRDFELRQLCLNLHLKVITADDCCLIPPGTLKTNSNQTYKVFSQFYRRAMLHDIQEQKHSTKGLYFASQTLQLHDASLLTRHHPQLTTAAIGGGRTEGIKLLATIPNAATYLQSRDIPAADATSHLSPHLKFGTLSIREVRDAIIKRYGPSHPLLRQLIWHDFFTDIANAYPSIFGQSFRPAFDHIPWSSDKRAFDAWCTGTTGFPIVDAGMRELVHTGTMHNRVRMITASFLVKDLHIDWRWGERFFARHLVDYDPAVNNGNWQWAASTGCDAQPYFRIFNPWLQQLRYDPDAQYIKQHVKELRDVPPSIIHTLYRMKISLPNYPAPLVDHSSAATEAKALFAEAQRRARKE